MGADSHSRGDSSQHWFLRLGDGGVFGPVSIATLVEWAKQGRVLAANEVSNDNSSWRPAASVEELGMTWYLESPGGALHGPFNRAAADLLARDGRLGEGARVIPASEADLSKLKTPAAAKKSSAADPQGELDFGGGTVARAAGGDDERESLRLQVNDLEEKLRQMVRNAEKEARSQERQKEALRKTIAELQREQEDLRQSTEAQTEMTDQTSAIEEALAAARQQFADEKAMADREADALRSEIGSLNSRIAEFESKVAELETALAAANEATAAAVQSGEDEIAALRARIGQLESESSTERDSSEVERNRLQAQLVSVTSERDRLQAERDSLALDAENRVRISAELEAKAADAVADHGAIAADRDRLQSELAAATANLAAATAARDAATSERDTAAADRDRLQSELAAARSEFAELLAASNERDAEYQRQVEEALAKAETTGATASAESQSPAVAVATIPGLPVELAESIDVIERVLAAEHEDFTAYRDATLKRQDLLRERVQALRSLQEAADGESVQSVSATGAAAGSARSLEAARLRDELESLRVLHQRTVLQAEERERELSRRVRTLESDDARMRARLGEADDANHRLRELTDSVRQRELELEQERYFRKVEQDQAQRTQGDMARRIEDLERRLNTSADNEIHTEGEVRQPVSATAPVQDSAAKPQERPAPAQKASRGFQLAPWMKLRR